MKNNKGVTLVELLVVIVVMGIIAGFAIPAVGNIIDNANKDALLNDAIQIENAARLYCSTTTDDEFCVDGDTLVMHSPTLSTDFTNAATLTNFLADYIDGLPSYSVMVVQLVGSDWEVYLEDGTYYFGSAEAATNDLAGWQAATTNPTDATRSANVGDITTP